MQKLISLLVIALSAIVFIASPMTADAATAPAPKVRYSAPLDICLLSFMRQYRVVKNFKEFNTLNDCEAYRASLKVPKPLPETFRYFDGNCVSSNDKKFGDLTVYISLQTKDACEKVKSEQVKQLADSILPNDYCTKLTFLNYSQKTFDCAFDVTDTTPFKLNPSFKIKAKLSVAQKANGSECALALKNPNEVNDLRMVLVCNGIEIGNHEDNANQNEGKGFKAPFLPEYFRVTDLNIMIGDSSDNFKKSTLYIADNPFTIQQGGNVSYYSFLFDPIFE